MLLFSIIIPLYNKKERICYSVDSVLSQSCKDFELLIVDDGSTDGSLDSLKRYNDSRIKIISKVNGGVSSARNYGISNAEGEWIVFLDADDTLLENALNIFAQSIQKHQNCLIHAANFINEYKGKLYSGCKRRHDGVIKDACKTDWFENVRLRAGSFAIHKSIAKTNLFNEQLRFYEDHLYIRQIRTHYVIAYSSKHVMKYCQSYSVLSTNISSVAKEWPFLYKYENDINIYDRLTSHEIVNSCYIKHCKAVDLEGMAFYEKLINERFSYLFCFMYKFCVLQRKIYNLLRKIYINDSLR